MQEKERGAEISVGGQRVRLGIPAAAQNAEAARMSIALGRVGTPEEAAGVSRTAGAGGQGRPRLGGAPRRTGDPAALQLPSRAAHAPAGAMLLLASPYASYITGQAIEVTGGGWL